MKIYHISLQVNFKTFHISTVRISTFHCNCPNICQLNFDLTEIFAVKLQNISDLSVNVFNRVYVTNSDPVRQIHFEFQHFIVFVTIYVNSIMICQKYLKLSFKTFQISQEMFSIVYM